MSRRAGAGDNLAMTPSGRCRGCGAAQMRVSTDGMGRAVDVPNPCRCRTWRRLRGVCRTCNAAVTGKRRVALYCDPCRSVARKQSKCKHIAKVGDVHQVAYRQRNRRKLTERAKARYRSDPAERERRNAYKRDWRRKNRDKVRAQKERANLRNFRESGKYATGYRERVATGEHVPAPHPRNQRGERVCLAGCGRVVTGRAKMCRGCKAPVNEREQGVAHAS